VEEICRKREQQPVTLSARKLAAGLWRHQLQEVAVAGDCGTRGGLRLQVIKTLSFIEDLFEFFVLLQLLVVHFLFLFEI
jgi:hypothetical protein